MAIRWQYLTVQIDVAGLLGPRVSIQAITEAFDRYGADGWELVSTLDINRGQGRTSEIIAFFERPLP